MSAENLNQTSDIVDIPKVNVDILKQRIFEEKKKERIKKTIIFSTVLTSLGVLTFLTY